MTSKHYNLTDKPNNDIKDKVPEWMDQFLEKGIETKKEKENFPSDYKEWSFGNSNKNNKINKCSICGSPLSSNEVDTCSRCND